MAQSPVKILFPKHIYKEYERLIIDINKGISNTISIAGTDYVPYYIDSEMKGNKGGNSFVLTLHNAQTFEQVRYDSPDAVLKILKFPKSKYETKSEKRFNSEVKALTEAKSNSFNNVIDIYNSGSCTIYNSRYGKFEEYLCYVMEYADSDLKKYVETQQSDLYSKIDLCMSIANGIKQLYSLGYYHRDLKPDNILIAGNVWKVGDLGLLDHRDAETKLDKINDLIGPRGWYSPEAMNKHLTEGNNNLFKFDCKIDHQSDIFQLGELFWYILQGNSPTGSVKLSDFKVNDSNLFAILKCMLSHSKKRRFPHVDDVIKLLKPIYNRYYKA